ncbi:MAG: glycosyltransferase [Geobacteraceae bacterium]|nr:glycosyltransferase [Geobacteraceae bacterium]
MITRPKGYMTFEQFRIIADKIRPYCRYLYLHLWGEPMLNPDIIQIIRYASQFTACNISTNGMCLTPQLAEELILSGVRDILFSIDGMTQETYQQYRVGGDVNKALMNLKMLQYLNQKHGNRVVISPQFVVFRHNQHEMRAFRNFCALFGLEASFKAPYIRGGHSNLCNSDFPEYVRKSYPDKSSRAKAMSGCPDPRDVMTILLDGSVVACCYDHNNSNCFGNIFQQDAMDIWNSGRFMAFRQQVAIGNPPNFCLESCLYFPAANIDTSRQAEQESAQGRRKYNEQCRELTASSAICTAVPVYTRPPDSCSCLFINTYYGGFLTALYGRNPQLAGEPYAKQKNILQLECFGDSDFYSYWLSKAGIPADDIIANCALLQTAWAIEQCSSLTGEDLLIEQIRQLNPSVVYVQDMNNTSREFLQKIRPFVRLIVGQIATPIVQQIPFDCYDLLFSSFPHYIERFRSVGLTAYYQPLAFDPRVLERVAMPAYAQRPVACSFVGGISALHVESYRLLEVLAEKTVTQFWGYGADTLPAGSMIIPRHRGEAWGRDMFSILGNSRITINRHGEVAENYANNMRLFEATGCGALLITDYKDNLGELFEIGKEVVAYRSPEECAALVNYYLAHPEAAEAIAMAGQARTLKDHTYGRRMEQTAELLSRHLRYQGETERLPFVDTDKVSYGHTQIVPQEITDSMLSAWRNSEIPAKQRRLVQHSLDEMYHGRTSLVFKVLADLLAPVVAGADSVLELGCASGYYYEILEYLLNRRIIYTGVDYSEAMIDMAREYYPKATFFAADGANLFFADRHFDVVISSGILLHVPNWRQHVFEAVRVAKMYVIASRTPVCRKNQTRHMKKFAYGVETVELIFNEGEFVREFQLNGMELINAIQYQADPVADEYEASYLFRRA